jgi:hypothetical protein
MMILPRPGETEQTWKNHWRNQAQNPVAGQKPGTVPNPVLPRPGTTTPAPLGTTPAPSPVSAPQTTPAGPNPNVEIGKQLTDPTPYNNAVAKGQGFLGTIPGNASFLSGASPMFRGMDTSRLNQQVGQFGGDLRNQAGLEFSRKAGTEVPRMLLAQLAGLRGLENDTMGLENTLLQNQVQAGIAPIQTIMRLLGAVGGFF